MRESHDEDANQYRDRHKSLPSILLEKTIDCLPRRFTEHAPKKQLFLQKIIGRIHQRLVRFGRGLAMRSSASIADELGHQNTKGYRPSNRS